MISSYQPLFENIAYTENRYTRGLYTPTPNPVFFTLQPVYIRYVHPDVNNIKSCGIDFEISNTDDLAQFKTLASLLPPSASHTISLLTNTNLLKCGSNATTVFKDVNGDALIVDDWTSLRNRQVVVSVNHTGVYVIITKTDIVVKPIFLLQTVQFM